MEGTCDEDDVSCSEPIKWEETLVLENVDDSRKNEYQVNDDQVEEIKYEDLDDALKNEYQVDNDKQKRQNMIKLWTKS